MTQATRALEAIHPYLSSMSDQAQRESRTRIWLDVISRAEGYRRRRRQTRVIPMKSPFLLTAANYGGTIRYNVGKQDHNGFGD